MQLVDDQPLAPAMTLPMTIPLHACRLLQVVHLAPPALAATAAYRAWAASLPGEQVRPGGGAAGAPVGFAAATRMLAKLSLISSRVFPLPLSADAAPSRRRDTAAAPPHAAAVSARAAAGGGDASAAPATVQGCGVQQTAGEAGDAFQAASTQATCVPAANSQQAAADTDQADGLSADAALGAADTTAPPEELDDIGELHFYATPSWGISAFLAVPEAVRIMTSQTIAWSKARWGRLFTTTSVSLFQG